VDYNTLHLKSRYVSTQTCNLPVLEMAFPFPVMAPISCTVLLWIPLLEIFHLVRYPNWQSAITGTAHNSCVPFPVLDIPFPVLGYAISGTVIYWALYRNWTLCTWSGSASSSLAGNVADMSQHVADDTMCRSNFGQMGPCRRHYYFDVVVVCVGLSRHLLDFPKCVCRNILWYWGTYAQILLHPHTLNAHFIVLLLTPRSFIRKALQQCC